MVAPTVTRQSKGVKSRMQSHSVLALSACKSTFVEVNLTTPQHLFLIC